MFTDRSVRCGGVTLRALVGPENGPPLVFLHGLGRRGADFRAILPALALGWQPHLLDLRGHGNSGHAAGSYRVRDHAEDVAAYLDEMPGHEPAVLIGHSLGALTAIAVAARRHDRVHAIVLEDPPGPDFLAHLERTPYRSQFIGTRELARRGGTVQELAEALADLRLPRPDGSTVRMGDLRDAASIRFSARCLQMIDPEVYTPFIDHQLMDDGEAESSWARVACPALLLRGDPALGGMLPIRDADRMSDAFPDPTRPGWTSPARGT